MTVKSEDLYRCLREDLLDQGLPTGETWPGMTIKQAAASSIANSFLKKLQVENSTLADKAALDKFIACNQACAEWSLPVEYDCKTEILLNTLRQVMDGFWHRNGNVLVDHPYDLLENSRVGPGVNRGARGESFYSKLFSSPLTCSSSSLAFWYKRYVRCFPEWCNAENIRQQHFGEATIVSNSRLSFVPKNDKISRCICIEPTLNTYFQLGFAHILERRLSERFGISLRNQQFKNRALARLGSITDGLSTIDLSSASDSISMGMLKWLLPPSFLRMLELCRCTHVEIPGLGTQKLHMISTMGNGYTFPLQTIIFSCVVTACMIFRFGYGSEFHNRSDRLWGVFGDDIICPKLVTSDVIALLNILGFSVNSDKTFVEGPFRESCGSDFFQGSDIRGVYVKTLRTVTARYAVVNQLLRFSTRTGINFFRTVRKLVSSFGKKLYMVPRWEDMSSGLHVPRSLANPMKDRNIQADAYMCLAPLLIKVRYQDGYVVVPRGKKQLIYNPSGLFLSFLQRSINDYASGVREDDVKYNRKRRVCSNWDNTQSVSWDSSESKIRWGRAWESKDYALDWRRWESVVDSHIER